MRTAQLRTAQMCTAQMRTVQIRTAQIRMTQMRTAQTLNTVRGIVRKQDSPQFLCEVNNSFRF